MLLKSTLASFPVIMLSIFVIPYSIADEIERIIRNFLWGSTVKQRKFHLLAWEKVCVELDWGGLGIKRIRDINVLLICKLLWELGNGENKPWK